jgi:predicted aconitase
VMENRGDKMEFKMELNQDERDILEGKQGETLQKIMKTVVEYGEMFGAKKISPADGSVSFGYVIRYAAVRSHV